MTTVIRLLCAAVVVWLVQAASAAEAGSYWVSEAATTVPAPVPLTTNGGSPIRWLAVGIAAALCAVLLTSAVLLVRHARSSRESRTRRRPGTWGRAGNSAVK